MLTNDRSGIIMRPDIFRARARAHDLSRGRESVGALLRVTFNALDSVINPFGCICSREKSVRSRAQELCYVSVETNNARETNARCRSGLTNSRG